MAYFKIEAPNEKVKYIKDVDRVNETLTFSTDREGCYEEDEGFFADSAFDYLKFHFTEHYPELEYMSIDSRYGYEEDGILEEPIQVNNVAVDAMAVGDAVADEGVF